MTTIDAENLHFMWLTQLVSSDERNMLPEMEKVHCTTGPFQRKLTWINTLFDQECVQHLFWNCIFPDPFIIFDEST